MTSFDAQRTDVVELTRQAEDLARERGATALAGEFAAAVDALTDGRLTVAAVGEFKRGKSLLLNVLLDETELFPVDTSIATNVVTTASYAEHERLTVHLRNKKGKIEQLEIRREDIAAYVTEQGNPNSKLDVTLLEIELPNEKLREGLMIVDTPGVGGLNSRHSAVTYGFVTEADVVLFVLDALGPLTTEELEFIERIRDHCHAILFVVTKKDKEAGYQRIVENTREKAAGVLGRPPAAIPVVPVSSVLKHRWMQTGKDSHLERSNFPELEHELWGLLRERRGALLLLRPLGVVARGLDGLIGPLEAELDVYGAQTEAELEAKEQEFKRDAARREQLQREKAEWRKTLRREVSSLLLNAEEMFDEGAATVHNTLSESLQQDELLQQPGKIINDIEGELTLVGRGIEGLLAQETSRISRRLAEQAELDLNPAAPDSTIAATAGAPELSPARSTGVAGERALAVMRGVSLGGGGGATAGFVVGSLVFPGVGSLIGAAIGGITAATQMARSQLKQLDKREQNELRASLKNSLEPWVKEALRQIRASMKRALKEIEHSINDSFEDMLKNEETRVRESLESIRKARRATTEEANARVRELSGPLERMQQLRQAAAASAGAVVAAAEGRPPAEIPRAPEPAAGDGRAPAQPVAAGADTGDWADE